MKFDFLIMKNDYEKMKICIFCAFKQIKKNENVKLKIQSTHHYIKKIF